MIVAENVVKSFRLSKEQKKENAARPGGGKVDAVAGISFTCKPGRIFSLLGPNGAGKTTALRMIATMLRPSSGCINVAGFNTVSEAGKVRRHIGFMTGSTGLYERLTPLEMIEYYGRLHGMEPAFLEKRKTELFRLLGMEEFAGRRIGKLSSGMKQKVSIARTMIHDPQVLIFDEPTVGLDVITAKSILQLIRQCRTDGKTVIFSTHIMGEVSLLSDDLAIIHRGRLLFNDTYQAFIGAMKTKSLEDEFIRRVEEA
ncbi:MAG: ATP-binding cassette domain-containing protein [Candidatus Aminicenantes bacterium]|nr:ATP-binding cassette domain-containing protein [Candidatus Aminicenantes bacterium]